MDVVGCGATGGSLLFYVAYSCHYVLDETHMYSRSDVVGSMYDTFTINVKV
jgi:hypothetical protein